MGLAMCLYRDRGVGNFAGFNPHALYLIKDFLTGDRMIPKNGKWFIDGKRNTDLLKLGTGFKDFIRYYRKPPIFGSEKKNSLNISKNDFNAYAELVMKGQPEELGYWRKAGGLHRYLVAHAQNGVDDCQYHEVGADVLAKLMTIFYRASTLHGKALIKSLDRVFDDSDNLIDEENYEMSESTANRMKVPDSKVRYAYEVIEDAINETDFKTDKIYYLASW